MMTKCEVSYCEDYDGVADLKNPLITFDINYNGCEINWFISDIDDNDIDIWKNIKDAIIYKKESRSFGGGGNSSWYCQCKNEMFVLSYDISGMGGDSVITIKIPCEEMSECVDKIIEILESASKNVKYIQNRKSI